MRYTVEPGRATLLPLSLGLRIIDRSFAAFIASKLALPSVFEILYVIVPGRTLIHGDRSSMHTNKVWRFRLVLDILKTQNDRFMESNSKILNECTH